MSPETRSKSTDTLTAPVVLVVEEHPELREVLIDVLGWQGYEVVIAHDDEEAVEVLRKRPVDLLVSDPVLEGDAPESATPLGEVEREFPDLPIVALADAVDETVYFRAWSTIGHRRTLRRPFRLSDLLAACREAVGARAQPPAGPADDQK